jgi:hypothetical protein
MRAPESDVAAQLKALEAMSAPELRVLWRSTFGRPHPGWVQKNFLMRSLAYHVQEKAHGGLSPALRRQLLRYAEEIRAKGRIASLDTPKIKPGTRLVREWGGNTHVVTAVETGFEYGGKRFGNLSVIARAITGTRWSGPAFFGLKKPSSAPKAKTSPHAARA